MNENKKNEEVTKYIRPYLLNSIQMYCGIEIYLINLIKIFVDVLYG